MDNLTWEAKEFEQPERHPNWFISLWILAAAFAVVGIILKSYLLVVFIIMAAGVINIYALKVPETIVFSLSREMLSIGEKDRGLDEFESFWIFEREDGNVLSLKEKKALRTHLEIPLADIDAEEVRKILSGVVLEKEQEESLIDILARVLKF